MKPLPFIFFVSLITATAHATEYSAVQTDKSTLTFISKQMGVPVNGSFPRFTAQVDFDPAKPYAGKVNISIDLASIDAGSKDANDEVVGKEWFNVRMFPSATFSSVGMKSVGGGKYEVTGHLALKGKSNPVIAPFSFKAEANSGVFDGSFTLKRIDYAIGEGSWTDVSMVANDGQVNFHIVEAASARPAVSAPVPAAAKTSTPVKSK